MVTLALVGRRANAHTAGISHGDYLWRDGRLLAGVAFSRVELTERFDWLVDRDGRKSLVAFEDQRQRLGAWMAASIAVAIDGEPCTPSFDAMRFDGDGIVFALAYACPRRSGRVTIDAAFVSDVGRSHRHLATLHLADRDDELTLSADAHSFALSVDSSGVATSAGASTSGSPFFPLVRMGIEHILTGYDHLLFLLGLVLVGGPLRSLAGAITAFTLSHSITLGLAAFGVWTPSPNLVEPCIALSIAYVGIESWFVDSAVGRYRVTFPFGLVHGFGFATALRAASIPKAEIPVALFGFNLGVELGQMAAIAVLLPLVLAVRKNETWRRPFTRAGAAAVGLAGVAWFVIRVRNAIG
ncbi:MAG TPA: HupE/UreJ family protein [Polyangiaceae bacterium]